MPPATANTTAAHLSLSPALLRPLSNLQCQKAALGSHFQAPSLPISQEGVHCRGRLCMGWSSLPAARAAAAAAACSSASFEARQYTTERKWSVEGNK